MATPLSSLSLLRAAPLSLRLPSRLPRTLTVTPFPNPNPNPNPNRRFLPRVSAVYGVPVTDRLLSAVSYTLPFLNSLPYGRILLARSPLVASLTAPFLPLLSTFHSLPHAQFLAFILLYLALAKNPNMTRYVRFNAMQAVLLDVILSFPLLLRRFIGTPSGRVGLRAVQYGYAAFFLIGFTIFFYGVASCLLGRTPYLPLVSSLSDRQL